MNGEAGGVTAIPATVEPDTDTLNGDNRVDVRFSGRGQRAHGRL